MKPITIKIDVTKLDKGLFFRAPSGAVYADLVAWPSRESNHGETHYVKQSKPKGDERKMPFIGSMTIPEHSEAAPPKAAPAKPAPPQEDDDYEPIPF